MKCKTKTNCNCLECLSLYERISELRAEGRTLKEISDVTGIKRGTIRPFMLTRGLLSAFTRKCDLMDCEVEFTTTDIRKRYCCKTHTKIGACRRELGNVVAKMECALPECTNLVFTIHRESSKPKLFSSSIGQFCCKDHQATHSRRLKTRWYDKLTGSIAPCEVCGHHLALDVHHEVYDTKTGSDLSGPVHQLCATHHNMIHRGYAVYRDGKYVVIVDELIQALARKKELYTNYFREEAWSGTRHKLKSPSKHAADDWSEK